MTQWNRRIGRQVTNAYPAWRTAMAVADRLYNVSSNAPNGANASLVFPGGIIPYGFGLADNQGWDVMSGYSSGVLLEDVGGPHGTIVVGTGGHTRIQNDLLSLNLSQDSPGFGWWQQPYFETSAVNGAELYYNQAVYNALPAAQKLDSEDLTAWIAAGKPYPIGYQGWVWPAKMTYGQLGNNNPHGFRYHAPCFIPPSFTGTGAGAYVVVKAPQGPFSQAGVPSGAADADFFDATGMWPSGRRKWWIWAKDTATGIWTRLATPQPDFAGYGFIHQHTAVARDQKRVYVSVDVGGSTPGGFYIDFSSGLAAAAPSSLWQGALACAPNRGSPGAFTDGHPQGKHLWFWPDLNFTDYFIVQDFDTNTQYRVGPISGYNVVANAEDCLIYDPTYHRILLVKRPVGNSITYLSIPIPADPTNAAGYVVSSRTLTVNGDVAVNSLTYYYKKCFLHPTLGVIFIPQDSGRMLAFKPSAP